MLYIAEIYELGYFIRLGSLTSFLFMLQNKKCV